MGKALLSVAVASAILASVQTPAVAGMAWFVVAGYSSPKVIDGPYDTLYECNRIANDYNIRHNESGFHCSYLYTSGSTPTQSNNSYGDSYSSHYYVVYHAADHTRIIVGPYPNFSECNKVALTYNTQNSDYRYGCEIHY